MRSERTPDRVFDDEKMRSAAMVICEEPVAEAISSGGLFVRLLIFVLPDLDVGLYARQEAVL